MNLNLRWRVLLVVASALAAVWVLTPSWRFYRLSEEQRAQGDPAQLKDWKEKSLRLGLDLQGGMHMVLELDESKLEEGVSASDLMDRALEIVRNRIDQFGVTEPVGIGMHDAGPFGQVVAEIHEEIRRQLHNSVDGTVGRPHLVHAPGQRLVDEALGGLGQGDVDQPGRGHIGDRRGAHVAAGMAVAPATPRSHSTLSAPSPWPILPAGRDMGPWQASET
jgi:hypothetical protein